MACAEFEDRLLQFAELDAADRQIVDAHIAGCSGCRAFRTALDHVDRALEQTFTGMAVNSEFDRAVIAASRRIAPVRKPSLVPLVLDFVAAAAVVFVGVALLDTAALLLGVGRFSL